MKNKQVSTTVKPIQQSDDRVVYWQSMIERKEKTTSNQLYQRGEKKEKNLQ